MIFSSLPTCAHQLYNIETYEILWGLNGSESLESEDETRTHTQTIVLFILPILRGSTK